ncbi:MAG TPA: hypothetical protein PLA68_05510 [Panacibacter sp.]|nr:hypothetical protein [Panacibacter sp.]
MSTPINNNPVFSPPLYIRKGRKNEKTTFSKMPVYFADFAILSAHVYRETFFNKPVTEAGKDTTATIPVTPPSGWLKWETSELLPIPAVEWRMQKFIEGMGYEIWDKTEGEKVTVAIVFRGTDFKEWGDWSSNLRWFKLNLLRRRIYESFYWDQYHQTKKLTPLLVEAIKEKHKTKSIKIITTGHSLGGGLAQLASYCCNDIKEVIAFDPSPVTGFYDVAKEQRDVNQKDTIIARVYQVGEVLSYLRYLLRFFYLLTEKDPEITEYGANFFKGDLIARHSIDKLAEKLSELLKNTKR